MKWLAARLENPGYGYTDGTRAAVGKHPWKKRRTTKREKEPATSPATPPDTLPLLPPAPPVTGSGAAATGQRLEQPGGRRTAARADPVITVHRAGQRETLRSNRRNQTGAA